MTTELLDTAAPSPAAESQDATQAATGVPVNAGVGSNPAVPAAQGAPATASADTPPADAGSDPAATAAVEYEPFTMPEGVGLDEEILGEFKATAKDLKLSQQDAQRLADLGAKMQTKQAENFKNTQTQWMEQSKTDKEFGGEALQENLGTAKRALEAFATPELRTLLNQSGLGNHPEVIRHFVRVGKAISEDGRIVSGSKAGAPADPAKRMFPNQA